MAFCPNENCAEFENEMVFAGDPCPYCGTEMESVPESSEVAE